MIKTKQQIIAELGDSFNSLADICTQVKHEHFNISNDGKWSAGENIQHLVNAAKMTNVAFNVPKFVHVLLYGKPGRTSHSCSKVIDNYQKQLEQGAKARGPYKPKKSDNQREQLQQVKREAQASARAADSQAFENTFFQLNVSNLFDEVYVGGFSGTATSTTSVPFAQIGAPRTVIGSISVGF